MHEPSSSSLKHDHRPYCSSSPLIELKAERKPPRPFSTPSEIRADRESTTPRAPPDTHESILPLPRASAPLHRALHELPPPPKAFTVDSPRQAFPSPPPTL